MISSTECFHLKAFNGILYTLKFRFISEYRSHVFFATEPKIQSNGYLYAGRKLVDKYEVKLFIKKKNDAEVDGRIPTF
jgi:hypothetical protein